MREAINFVRGSRSAPDLLVKVFVYRTPKPLSQKFSRGNYRNTWIHGYYRSDFPNGRPERIQSIITLKMVTRTSYDATLSLFEVGDYIADIQMEKGYAFVEDSEEKIMEDLVGLFAHEFKHYLDMRKLRSKEKWRHWEVRAKKFSEKILKRWRWRNREINN